MAGPELDVVRQRREPPQRVVQRARRLLDGLLGGGEVGPGHVADEQRVAREQRRRPAAARAVGDHVGDVLGPMTGCRDRFHAHVAERDRVAVAERLVRERGAGAGGHEQRCPGRGDYPAAPGHVVGVRVRLQHARDAQPVRRGEVEVPADVPGRVDDGGLAGVADQVRRAPQVLVDELAEDHATASALGSGQAAFADPERNGFASPVASSKVCRSAQPVSFASRWIETDVTTDFMVADDTQKS